MGLNHGDLPPQDTRSGPSGTQLSLWNWVPGASQLAPDRLHPVVITQGGALGLAVHTTSDLTVRESGCPLPVGLQLRLCPVGCFRVPSAGCAPGRSPTASFLHAPGQVLTAPASHCSSAPAQLEGHAAHGAEASRGTGLVSSGLLSPWMAGHTQLGQEVGP